MKNIAAYDQPNKTAVYEEENDYLVLSIFNALCCCMGFGIAALIFSVKTRSANQAGNAYEARDYSKTARLLNIIGISIGCVVIFSIIVLILAGLINLLKRPNGLLSHG